MKRFDWRRMPAARALGLAALAFLYAPLLVLVAYSFNANRLALIWTGFSPRWFAVALLNEDLRRTAVNSLVVAAAATAAATALALPLVAPELVTAISTLVLFETVGLRAGLLNVVLAHTVFCIPFAIMPMRARLREMGRDLEDAALDLYASRWGAFRSITLPLMMPAVVAGAMLSFVVSLDDFLITLMVAPAGATTLPVYLYGMLRLGVTPEANAAATLLLAVSATAVAAAFLVGGRRGA